MLIKILRNLGALIDLLKDKGIITQEELRAKREEWIKEPKKDCL